jgi:hypothetical protein
MRCNRTISISSLIFIFFLACAAPKQLNTSHKEKLNIQNLRLPDSAREKIVFLGFDISVYDSGSEQYDIALKSIISAAGRLKEPAFGNDIPIERNYLYFQLEGNDGTKSEVVKLHHPLHMIYEHPGDNNTIEKTVIHSNKGELSVRFQWKSDYRFLSIYDVQRDSLTLKKIYYATLQ